MNGIGAVRATGPHLAHHRRTGDAPDHRRPGVVPAPAQRRPGRTVDRGAEPRSGSVSCHPSGPSSSTTATSTGCPVSGRRSGRVSNAKARSTSTIRSTGRCSCCSRSPTRVASAQRACRLMLVDEFQDLTPAHLLLIRLLAAPGGDVFGVGDDDQTIYGYNGADPAWLIDFAELFPGAGDHPLEVNYRCPAGTVDVVDRLLRHNGRRVAKTIRACVDRPGRMVRRSVRSIRSRRAATSVQRAIADGAAPTDVAVLARVNASLAPIQVALASSKRADRRRRRARVRRTHGRSRRAGVAATRGCGSDRRRRLRSGRSSRGAATPVAFVPPADQRLGDRATQRRRSPPARGAAEQGTRHRTRHRVRRRHPVPAEAGRIGCIDVRCRVRTDRRDRSRRLGRDARRSSPGDEPGGPGRRPDRRPTTRRAPRRRRDVRVVAALASGGQALGGRRAACRRSTV